MRAFEARQSREPARPRAGEIADFGVGVILSLVELLLTLQFSTHEAVLLSALSDRLSRWEVVTRRNPPRRARISSPRRRRALRVRDASARKSSGRFILHDNLRRRWRQLSPRPAPALVRIGALSERRRVDAGGSGSAVSSPTAPAFDPRADPIASSFRRLAAGEQRQSDEHPMQGVHADVPVHDDRGEAQGALRQQAPQERLLPVLPPPQGVMWADHSAFGVCDESDGRLRPSAAARVPRRRRRSSRERFHRDTSGETATMNEVYVKR